MPEPADACTFQRLTELPGDRPTLVEGLPGLGMVASITVDQLNDQLGLEHHGNIRSETFPPLATFEGGEVVDPVRVYTGADPDVMTLQSAIPLPPQTFPALAGCVLDRLAEEFEQAIFLVGIPAQNEEELGAIRGVATDEAQLDRLRKSGVEVAGGQGLVGGPTGALLDACHQRDIPAICLLTKVHPRLPDPGAAQVLIEEALEPLVDFDIDTSELEEQAAEIQRQLEQVAQEYQRMQKEATGGHTDEPSDAMYQ